MHIQKSFGGWVHRDLEKLKYWCTESPEKEDGQSGLGRCRERCKEDYLMQVNKPCKGRFI